MPAVDLETVSRLARIAFAAGEYYAFCRVVPLIAQAVPNDPYWRTGYLQSLTKLGLNAAARQLVEEAMDQARHRDKLSELAESLRAADSGQIPWASLRRAFSTNLAALERREPAAAEMIRQAWDAASDKCELHRANDGNYLVREIGPAWPPRWLPALDDHRALAASRVDLRTDGTLPPVIVFQGVGLGWELLHAYAKTKNVFLGASSVIYVVEHDPRAVAVAFHLHDWRELLTDPRVVWFVGDKAADRFRQFLEADPQWPISDRMCRASLFPAAEQPSVSAAVTQAADSRAKSVIELRRRIEDRYAGRDADWWSRRFAEAVDDAGRARGRPLRVLGFTSLHTTFLQYSMRDCLRALEALGHQTRLIIEPNAHIPLAPIMALQAQLDFEPDAILLLSRMRYEMPWMLHPAIPSITWDQDTLHWVFDSSKKPQLAWNDFLMGYAARGVSASLGWPAHRCRFCAMAGSSATYSAEPLPPEELAPYRCDVSYVSHSSATVEQELREAETWLPDERLRRIFRAAVERLLPDWLAGGGYPGPVMTALLDVCEQAGEPPPSYDELCKLTQPVHRIAGRAFRHVALGWAADWADRTGRVLHLWGNGWERHPRLAKYARGPAKNGEELRRIYQASAINLQLMQTGFFHQRALDGLMAGGFFIGRRSEADQTGPLLRELVALLDRHRVDSAAVLASIPDEEARRQIIATLVRFGEDPRAICPKFVDARRASANDDFIDEKMPGFEELLFSSAADFEAKAERFLADAALRTKFATTMRQVLLKGYSYEARMAEMLLFLRKGLEAEAALHSPPPRSRVVPPPLVAASE